MAEHGVRADEAEERAPGRLARGEQADRRRLEHGRPKVAGRELELGVDARAAAAGEERLQRLRRELEIRSPSTRPGQPRSSSIPFGLNMQSFTGSA